ncbi:protein phosphatase 1 regulatory subunit 37-like [Amblyraja radiata]|uniref:protein phosphatase 1 regulatory subunit 37-like n=1 Tax=Amblyraja radiata TaxID=386614 RepID=UPI001402A3C8|nr:protein phosphatase 1 regulatory subunit 37-like [Amblyraja radiata]
MSNEMSAAEDVHAEDRQAPVQLDSIGVKDDCTGQQERSPNSKWKIKSKKRVSFPSGEEIVSGSVEPLNPWKADACVTVEEIITSYNLSCKKLNVQPIHNLLTQLQEITEVQHWIACLDLKGEKLDYESCEALEEIFKRIRFKMINLEWAKLHEDGASALFDMMEYYDSTLCLSISFSRTIGTRGWRAAAQLIRTSSSLQEFEASGIPLTEHSASYVARGLKFNRHLRVLRLDNTGLSGRSLMLLVSALKMNQVLQELYLADNNLNSVQDSMYLRDLLEGNGAIRLLDLKNNCIFNTGLEDICEGLKRQKQGLKTLILWNNRLTHKGMNHLSAILPKLRSLETLNLGRNPLSNEGIRRLKEGLIANRSITRLGLASTAITCEGAIATAEFLVESSGILRLDLRRNRIKTGGLMALTLAMKLNRSLVQLDLDKGPVGEKEGWLIETQKLLQVKIAKCCKRNSIVNGTQLEEGTNEATQTGVSQGKRSNRKTWDRPVRTEVSLNEDYKHVS